MSKEYEIMVAMKQSTTEENAKETAHFIAEILYQSAEHVLRRAIKDIPYLKENQGDVTKEEMLRMNAQWALTLFSPEFIFWSKTGILGLVIQDGYNLTDIRRIFDEVYAFTNKEEQAFSFSEWNDKFTLFAGMKNICKKAEKETLLDAFPNLKKTGIYGKMELEHHRRLLMYQKVTNALDIEALANGENSKKFIRFRSSAITKERAKDLAEVLNKIVEENKK